MRQTIYDKLKTLKEELKKELNLDDETKIFRMTAKLSTWHYPKKRSSQTTIDDAEKRLYEFYIIRKYNPPTAYKWMFACNTTLKFLHK